MTPNDRAQVEQDLFARMRAFSGLEGRWKSTFNTTAVDGAGYRSDVNFFLRIQLGALPNSTVDARLCLEDTSDYRRWLQLLERHVFPLLNNNQLPVSFKELVTWISQESCV